MSPIRSQPTIERPWKILFAAALLLLLIGAIAYRQINRSAVTVINKSGQTANQVIVSVKGASYSLGNVGDDHSASANVRPRGESDVSLSYISSAGVQRKWKGGSLEGSRYRMTLVIQPGGSVKGQTRLKP